jgi:hypothetical protein
MKKGSGGRAQHRHSTDLEKVPSFDELSIHRYAYMFLSIIYNKNLSPCKPEDGYGRIF